MAEGIGVSRYGVEIQGSTTIRESITNAPVGHTFYDTTQRRMYVMGPRGWEIAGTEEEQSSSSSSSSSQSSLSSSSQS